MIGALRGYEKPKKPEHIQQAASGAIQIPNLIIRLLPLVGGAVTAMESWQGWQNKNTQEREDDLKKLDEREERHKKCDILEQRYVQRCNEVTKIHGKQAGAICFANAMDVVGSCRAGKPESDWPPFHF